MRFELLIQLSLISSVNLNNTNKKNTTTIKKNDNIKKPRSSLKANWIKLWNSIAKQLNIEGRN